MISLHQIRKSDQRLHEIADAIGALLVHGFHFLALFVIGATTVWAAVFAFRVMVEHGSASIEDILLLFIYLELGAMVGIYFRTNHMPVRFLIYIAITALTRLMISHASVEHKADLAILIIAGGILTLALAVLVLRYGSSRFPSLSQEERTPPAADQADGG
jgi:phosphate starvation-inducible membrane PsiE